MMTACHDKKRRCTQFVCSFLVSLSFFLDEESPRPSRSPAFRCECQPSFLPTPLSGHISSFAADYVSFFFLSLSSSSFVNTTFQTPAVFICILSAAIKIHDHVRNDKKDDALCFTRFAHTALHPKQRVLMKARCRK